MYQASRGKCDCAVQDRSGRLSLQEIGDQCDRFNLDRARVEDVFDQCDADQDDRLSYEEVRDHELMLAA